MAASTVPARRRNYTIDLLRVVAALFMTTFHWIWMVYFPGHIDNGYWGAYFFTQDHAIEGWDWFKGTYTMGFFVFVTGYFLMAGFKSMQRRGLFKDKRTHFMYTWRFTAKTYCSYAPLMLFGTAFGWILTNTRAGASIMDWINTFVWNIWQFLGVSGFGMFETNASKYVTVYFGAGWYIAAFIVFACVFYAILIRSEKAAVFIFCPVMFMMSNIWLNQWLDPETGAQTLFGITTLLPQDVVRLWGPLALGIWGWYAVDALKRAKLTKHQENGIAIVWVLVFAYCLITSWTGYLGGMLNQDVAWMIVAGLALAGRDPVTRWLDDKLQRFPLSRYFADFSAGLYIVHLPIVSNLCFDLIDIFGMVTAPWVFELICIGCALIYMVVNAFVLKPLYGKLSHLLKAREPVVIEDDPAPVLNA